MLLFEKNPWLIPVLFVLGIVVGLWLGNRLRRFWLRRELARRWHHARRGEEQARSWLERNGFTILDEQVSQQAYLIVNGEESPFSVRADYLVERAGIRAIVEVKTGAVADPSTRGTRRQILEYAQVYGVSDVYLFDADREQLHHIGVPNAPSAPAHGGWSTGWLVGLFVLGALAGAFAAWWVRS